MRRLPFLAASAAILAAACATPTVERSQAEMSPAEIAEAGLECRREKPMGTIRAQTICASPEAWADYEKKTSRDSDLLFDQVNSQPNGGFSGN